MTFLSPSFLWFLPLITLPVIIHLLAKRKSKLIDFPSLKFLKLLEQDALKKFNVKQLILLIIRTLMILLIILAFARPNLNVSGGFQLYTQNVDILVVAIDNTASNSENLDALSGSWLETFQSDMEEKGYRVLFCGLTDFNLQSQYTDITPEFSGIHDGSLVDAFEDQIDLEQFREKSILWIGDGQDVREYIETLGDWNKFVLLRTIENDFGVSNLKLPHRGIHGGDAYQVQVDIAHALEVRESLALELIVNEARQNQTVILPEVPSVEMLARVGEPGFQSGRFELGSDEHNYNNSRHYVLPAAGKIPVQILRSSKALDFWSIVSQSAAEQEVNLDIRLLDYSESDNLTLNQGGTVIVEDASKLVDYNWNRLKSFVSQGGQLILFGAGGDRFQELLNFNTSLNTETNPFPLGLFVTPPGKKALKSPPLETAIAQNRLKVYQRFSSGSAELEETWIRYLDGQAFLGNTRLNEGRVIWFNTEFGIRANNLPLLGVFPTLILQLCQSQEIKDHTSQYNAEVGDTLHFFPGSIETTNTPFNIQRPDGTVDYLTPDSNYVIHYASANIPGIYSVTRGRQVLQPLAVNISAYEAQAHSRLYDLSDSDMFISNDQHLIVTEILDRHSGIALWPIFLILLLLLQVIETYLSRIKSTWR